MTNPINVTSNTGQIVVNNTVNVYDQGIANIPIIKNGGVLNVYNGGTTIGAYISSGGLLYVSSGGSASNTTTAKGSLISANGGKLDTVNLADSVNFNASNATINNMSATQKNTGTFTDCNISSGTLGNAGNFALAGGEIHDFIVYNSFITLRDGAESYGMNVSNYARLVLDSNTKSFDTTIDSYASQTVGSHSIASNTSIVGYGSLVINSGGIAYNTSNFSNGSVIIKNGAVANDTSVINNGSVVISNGGVANNISVINNGSVVISNGGVANNISVISSGSIVISSGATVSNLSVINKGSIVISSGGVVDNLMLSSAGKVTADNATLNDPIIYGNLTAKNTTINNLEATTANASTFINSIINGGKISNNNYNFNGGVSKDLSIESGTISLTNSAESYNATLSNGATQYVNNNGKSYNTVVLNGATQIVNSGGIAYSTVVSSGGTVTVHKGATIDGDGIAVDGGQLNVSNGAIINAPIQIRNTTLTINQGNKGIIVLQGGGNVINMVSNGQIPYASSLTIEGFTQGDTIVIPGYGNGMLDSIKNVDAEGNPNNDYISIYSTAQYLGGPALTFHIPGVGDQFKVSALAGNRIMITSTVPSGICFLPGSLINTPNGDIPIEEIKINDEVIVFDWKHNINKVASIKWVGNAQIQTNQSPYDDEAGYPVRILKDAVAEGVPYKDLLVTSEHCLFFDNQFIPVRMLVNKSSIYYDKNITTYTYYHIETEEHSVIYANGMLTESYLDTGNRNKFKQSGNIVRINSKRSAKNWKQHAGAQLTTNRAAVEPIYNKIIQRANDLGILSNIETIGLTNNPNFHLITEAGAIIESQTHKNGKYTFIIPENVNGVFLTSKTSRPSDVIGPFIDDRRQLGVLVGEIYIINNNSVEKVTEHLSISSMFGWDVVEESPCRWTNGSAYLNIQQNELKQRALIIEVLSSLQYPISYAPKKGTIMKKTA